MWGSVMGCELSFPMLSQKPRKGFGNKSEIFHAKTRRTQRRVRTGEQLLFLKTFMRVSVEVRPRQLVVFRVFSVFRGRTRKGKRTLVKRARRRESPSIGAVLRVN